MEYMMAMLESEKDNQRPAKHYGFGLPKHYRVVDVETGSTVTAVEHKDVAQTLAAQNAEITGHRFETRAMWM